MTFLVIIFVSLLLMAGIFIPSIVVYVWAFVGTLHLVFPRVTLIEGADQTLYGAVSLVSLPLLITTAIVNYSKIKKHCSLLPLILLMGVIALLSGFLNGALDLSTLRTVGGIVVFFFICLFSYSFLGNEKSIRTLALIFTVLSLILSVYAILDFFFIHRYARVVVGVTVRGASFLITNANMLSHYCLFFFALFFSLALMTKKPAFWGIGLVYLITILTTFSNAGFAALVVVVAVIVLFTGMHKNTLFLIYSILGIMLLAVFLFEMNVIGSSAFHHLRTGGTISGRFNYIWPAALKLIEKSPVWGYTPALAFKLLKIDAHNELLSVLLNYGVIGAATVLLMFFSLFRQLRIVVRKPTASPLVRACALGCLSYIFGSAVYGFSHSIGFESITTFPFWFISLSIIGSSEFVEDRIGG